MTVFHLGTASNMEGFFFFFFLAWRSAGGVVTSPSSECVGGLKCGGFSAVCDAYLFSVIMPSLRTWNTLISHTISGVR